MAKEDSGAGIEGEGTAFAGRHSFAPGGRSSLRARARAATAAARTLTRVCLLLALRYAALLMLVQCMMLLVILLFVMSVLEQLTWTCYVVTS